MASPKEIEEFGKALDAALAGARLLSDPAYIQAMGNAQRTVEQIAFEVLTGQKPPNG